MSALSPSQQPTVLFSIYQNNTWTIRCLVNETIIPSTQRIILKIVWSFNYLFVYHFPTDFELQMYILYQFSTKFPIKQPTKLRTLCWLYEVFFYISKSWYGKHGQMEMGFFEIWIFFYKIYFKGEANSDINNFPIAD